MNSLDNCKLLMEFNRWWLDNQFYQTREQKLQNIKVNDQELKHLEVLWVSKPIGKITMISKQSKGMIGDLL